MYCTHKSFIMSSAMVVKPAIIINSIASDPDVEAGEI